MKNITEKEAKKAFDVLHDYCDERECNECMFLDETNRNVNMCVLRNNSPAFLRIDEIPVITYKIRRGDE